MDSDPLYGDDPTADRDDAPSPSDDTALKPPGSDSPRRIGGYHVKSVIASGGMGTVYVALQEQPRRTVALKVMKAGIASRSALRRFEYESQILARLRHPNIAQVYEAGTHDDGSGGVPYFAMEYVPGAMPLAEYAINKKLSTRERLDLFAKVCDAVHHGHQKGIIHRDLKPSNILVDSSGEPKIIDFGVARATDSDLAVTTLQTDIGQLIGTVQYMSPEQFAADPHDLDTRSDVYALGVVLFEMLCEQLPYDVTRVALHEAARVVREDEPAKPSTINRTLRGDVETITLKAMEKDRDRRYRSAEALAEDVRHYLRDEPIEARPPSLIDQARRFGRRHRAVAVSAAVIGLVLLASTGIIVQQLVLSRAAQHRAETINDFFMSVTRSASPFARRASSIVVPGEEDVDERLRTEYAFDAGTDPTVGHVFRFAAKQMDRYQWDPEVEISLRAAIGSTLRDTGHLTEATRHLRLAIEKQQAQRGVSVSDSIRLKRELALSLALAGRWKEALSEYRAAYDASRESLGAGNPLTIEVSEGVADALGGLERRDEAIEHLEQSVEAARRERGEDDKLVLLHSFRLALAVAFRDTDEALEIASKAFEAIEARASASSFARIEAHHLYGNLLQNAGWSVSAVPVLEESLRLSRAAYGEDHPATSRTAFTLCTALFELGRFEATLDICEGLLTLHETQRGPDSVPALMAMNCVAASLAALDRDISRAEELAEHARSCLARTHGAGSREVIYVRVTLATIRERQGQLQAARDMLEAIIQDLQSRPTFKDSLAIEVPRQLGHIMVHEGRFRDAEDLLLATHDEAVATFGEQSTIARSVAEEIAQLYDAWGNSGEAERWRTSPHTSGE